MRGQSFDVEINEFRMKHCRLQWFFFLLNFNSVSIRGSKPTERIIKTHLHQQSGGKKKLKTLIYL